MGGGLRIENTEAEWPSHDSNALGCTYPPRCCRKDIANAFYAKCLLDRNLNSTASDKYPALLGSLGSLKSITWWFFFLYPLTIFPISHPLSLFLFVRLPQLLQPTPKGCAENLEVKTEKQLKYGKRKTATKKKGGQGRELEKPGVRRGEEAMTNITVCQLPTRESNKDLTEVIPFPPPTAICSYTISHTAAGQG